jgi:hypothetical protein
MAARRADLRGQLLHRSVEFLTHVTITPPSGELINYAAFNGAKQAPADRINLPTMPVAGGVSARLSLLRPLPRRQAVSEAGCGIGPGGVTEVGGSGAGGAAVLARVPHDLPARRITVAFRSGVLRWSA